MTIYLDNAATTKLDDEVLSEMLPYLTESYGNAGTLYELGRRSAKAIALAREQVAGLIRASPEQVIFTSGGAEANNMVFAGVEAYLTSRSRCRVITSRIEHDSVLRAVFKNSNLYCGAYLSPNKNGEILLTEEAKALIEDDVAGIVSIMHTNNETGLKTGVEKFGGICSKNGVLFHTDCVQAAACTRLNVNDLKCDFLSLSSHKIHGPKGVGALYARSKSILSPLIAGGKNQEFGQRGGTENVAGIVGFGKACEILNQRLEDDARYIGGLRRMLYGVIKAELSKENLSQIMHINGDADLHDDGKILSVRFDGVDAETLLLMLDSRGVCVSAGSACRSRESEPSHVLLVMGLSPEDARNSIRLSLSRMNSVEEIREAACAIAGSVAQLRQPRG